MGKNKRIKTSYRLNHYIPFGYFCYEDINSYTRYYCPYLKGCNSCRLTGTDDIFDFIKICKKE